MVGGVNIATDGAKIPFTSPEDSDTDREESHADDIPYDINFTYVDVVYPIQEVELYGFTVRPRIHGLKTGGCREALQAFSFTAATEAAAQDTKGEKTSLPLAYRTKSPIQTIGGNSQMAA